MKKFIKLGAVAVGSVILAGCDDAQRVGGQVLQKGTSVLNSIPGRQALPGGSSVPGMGAPTRVEMKRNIDPRFAFVQDHLSGSWTDTPFSRNCDRASLLRGFDDGFLNGGSYSEFSFDGDNITQYFHSIINGNETIHAYTARIVSAKQTRRDLGSGKTLVGELDLESVSSGPITGNSTGTSNRLGDGKTRFSLVEGSFPGRSSDFSGKGAYVRGGAGAADLMSCSGTFERREPEKRY